MQESRSQWCEDAESPWHIDMHRVTCMEQIVRDWIAEPDVLVLAGHWGEGALMEIVPTSSPVLTGQLYTGRFAGLRDMILDGEDHHLHMDLGRLTRATYIVSPSVCFGFRPSFEVRMHACGTDPMLHFGFGMALRMAYHGAQIHAVNVQRYFEMFRRHRSMYPEIVSIVGVDAAGGEVAPSGVDWRRVGELAIGHAGSDCRRASDLAKLLMSAQTDALE